MMRRFIIVLFSLFLSLQVMPASAQLHAPRQADTAKKCAICHYRWIYSFFVEHKATPLAPLQEQEVVGSKEMCLSCHDGSVRDSRDRICNDPGHQVGVMPSARITIPRNFPLDEQGRMQCVTCHTPHAVSMEEGKQFAFFLRSVNRDSSFCKECHIENSGGPDKRNHPVDISAGKFPEPIIQAGGKVGKSMPDQIICETCHIPHGGINNKFLVLSIEDPLTRSVLCEVCHTRNPARIKSASAHTFSHPLDITPGKAAQIPKKWECGENVVLGTGGVLVCRTCHKPHGAIEKKALLADRSRGDSLCTQCHRSTQSIVYSPHNAKISAHNTPGQKQHAGMCSPCHSIHNAYQKKYIWALPRGPASVPGWEGASVSGTSSMIQLCTACHAPGKMAEKKVPRFGLHPKTSMSTSAPGQAAEFAVSFDLNSETYPLFTDDGERKASGTIVCSTCHDPHRWDSYRNPEAAGAAAEGNATSSFLRPDISAQFCAKCHGEEALFKFLYFHGQTGRMKKKLNFPFKE